MNSANMTHEQPAPEEGRPHLSPFENILRIAEDGSEFWLARELAKLLGYAKWVNFVYAIDKAKDACGNSGQASADHFAATGKLIKAGKGAQRTIEDYRLSRYACYLIVQNADPAKPIVALGQTYFAVQTRRAELADQLEALPEDQKRLYLRSEMEVHNLKLAEAAKQAGILKAFDFATFQDHGYQGLYTLASWEIHHKKGLKEGQKILDHMGSEELGANIFRATQTHAKLNRDEVTDKEEANRTHYRVGREVRETIKRLGGTMPEDLPAAESITVLQQKEQKRLEQAQKEQKLRDAGQLSLFEDLSGKDS